MIASKLLNTTIPAIKLETTFIQALEWMSVQCVQHLAFTDEQDNLLSIVSEYQILDQEDLYEQFAVLAYQMPEIVAQPKDSIFDLLVKLQQHKLSAIPVTTPKGKYMGLITTREIINTLAQQYSFYGKGGLIYLTMPAPKYSMVEIARIVESNDAKVLSSILDYKEEEQIVNVLLKVSETEPYRILATFERFDYEAETLSQTRFSDEEDLQDNYDALIHYLNI